MAMPNGFDLTHVDYIQTMINSSLTALQTSIKDEVGQSQAAQNEALEKHYRKRFANNWKRQ